MRRNGPPSLFRELVHGPKSASALAKTLGLSQSGFSRLFKSASKIERVRSFGAGRATLYAATREIAGFGSTFPFFKVDEEGRCHPIGELTAIENRGFVLAIEGGKPETYPGIPFFLSDARPQGYLGRVFAERHADLGFPKRVPDWSEDQVFAALAARGEHLPGNLLVGEGTFSRFQNAKSPPSIPLKARATEYEKRSVDALYETTPGSSAAGEQPKFPAFLSDDRHVLVKFSPKTSTPKGRRWADLLLAEYHAIETVREELGIPVARTEIVEGDSRIYLESTRFDRIGRSGRKGCLTFASLESEWVGSPSVWATSAKTLLERKRISSEDAKRIRMLDAFGAWTANSDRHYGNLSFFYEVGETRAALAPVYDMLPMFFAPRETEDAPFRREWIPPSPSPDTLSVWEESRRAAIVFWNRLLKDRRIGSDFRSEAKTVLSIIERTR